MLGETYVRLVLSIAPFLVCLAWRADGSIDKQDRTPWLAALAFAGSVFFAPMAVWAAAPWLGVSIFQAVRALKVLRHRHLSDWCQLAAQLYLPVGGIWAIFAQANFQPLGFASVIVLLTGVHFHYAGFALPWLTGRWVARRKISRVGRAGALGVILGVPLVAIGITTSQLAMPAWIETAAVTILAASAFAVSHGYLAWSRAVKGPCRACFLLGGLALALGMTLALLYGWRYWFPIEWVTIPAMYTLHGTLNSWGFCLPGILGNSWLSTDQDPGGGEGPG
jgi:hypothetical protein